MKKLVFAVAILLASVSNAQGKKASLHDQYSGTGYGVAGCGLGSVIFGAKPGMIQVPAATTNGIYGIQTFGITSGTSNCDIPKMGQTAAVYLEANQEVVAKDAARGEGETLVDLAVIYNCQDAELFSSKVKANYKEIFTSDNGYTQSSKILSTIKNDSELAKNCSVAG
ncbi:DUF3015 family protein [Bdellovibrio reynosensis]|uniref:DUF3015 domain-containing protein n=1 Tax=Bdellovibrio reynosensis TaxID=2835041 RepID=A0ABY4C734_9BACT|nr:DUF3015 family protein [Bdellovibrio reynosensis]UOF00619.1 DUF3015 domain-containing protein [Bdellovibrio reynosensis]